MPGGLNPPRQPSPGLNPKSAEVERVRRRRGRAVSCDREEERQRWQRTVEVEGRSSISKQRLCISAREGKAQGEGGRKGGGGCLCIAANCAGSAALCCNPAMAQHRRNTHTLAGQSERGRRRKRANGREDPTLVFLGSGVIQSQLQDDTANDSIIL